MEGYVFYVCVVSPSCRIKCFKRFQSEAQAKDWYHEIKPKEAEYVVFLCYSVARGIQIAAVKSDYSEANLSLVVNWRVTAPDVMAETLAPNFVDYMHGYYQSLEQDKEIVNLEEMGGVS